MKLPVANTEDERLNGLFREIALICCSYEFEKLWGEMSRLYRKSGMKDARQTAFQDTLFSIYIEQTYPETEAMRSRR